MLPDPVIYLDYNATTPVAPEVVNEMLPLFLSNFGNASSNDHILGWRAKEFVDQARASLAKAFGCGGAEIIFTGGATESINMVLRGFRAGKKNHIITAKTEHNAVLDTCQQLENEGFRVTYLDVDEDGLISLEELEAAITEDTLLVTVMWVNNETGVIQPIEKIGALCKDRGVVFMSDATQAIGRMSIDLSKIPVDIILGSAHKIYGPKGIGFLRITKTLQKQLTPITTGGGQEYGKRAGTTNVPSIVGMSKAISLAYEQLDNDAAKIEALRNRFEDGLANELDIAINGSLDKRLFNASNLRFTGYDSERIMQAIGSKIAASRGSACSTGRIEPSHVLAAMGLQEEEAHASIRFSFGRYTTEEEVNKAIGIITNAVKAI